MNKVVINEGVDENIANDGPGVVRNGKQGAGAVNVTSRDEHEQHVERFNQTLEERVRCLLCAFVNRYELVQNFRFPKKIIIGAVHFFNSSLNRAYPARSHLGLCLMISS